MELRERSQNTVWGLDPASLISDDNFDNIDSIEIDETELLPNLLTASLPSFLPAEADFLSDEVYIELNRRYEARLQAAREAIRAAARVQAPRPVTAQAALPSASVAKPAPRKARGQIYIDEFKGDQFPVLPVTGMPPINYELITDEENLKRAVEILKDE